MMQHGKGTGTMTTLAVSVGSEELEAGAGFCRAEGIGMEVTEFARPGILDKGLSEAIDRLAGIMDGLSPVIVHGPIFELVVTSLDPAIVQVCRDRHTAALKAAASVGASIYVAHTNYTPIILNPSYRNQFTRRMLDFWLPLADWAGDHGIIISLENLWEPGPGIQADIIEKAAHPNLKATLDNGHVLVFSDIPSPRWVDRLHENLVHCHLHDNSGRLDEHLAIGEGAEQWSELIGALLARAPDAMLVSECTGLEANRKSLLRLRRMLKEHSC